MKVERSADAPVRELSFLKVTTWRGTKDKNSRTRASALLYELALGCEIFLFWLFRISSDCAVRTSDFLPFPPKADESAEPKQEQHAYCCYGTGRVLRQKVN